jgi:hypothetical protein
MPHPHYRQPAVAQRRSQTQGEQGKPHQVTAADLHRVQQQRGRAVPLRKEKVQYHHGGEHQSEHQRQQPQLVAQAEPGEQRLHPVGSSGIHGPDSRRLPASR